MNHFADLAAAARFSAAKMQKNNLFTTERLFCDLYCFEPGQEQTPHSHAGSDKIYVVRSGTASIRIGDDERTVAAGTAALAPAGLSHAIRNPGPDRLEVLVFMAPKPA